MQHSKEFETFRREGVLPPRSYYIPFGEADFAFRHGILHREASDRFISLNGAWQFRAHDNINGVEIEEPLSDTVNVPSCVQMLGYDRLQYINVRYPIPVDPPHVPAQNPVFHYRRTFTVTDTTARYYLNFEGVDSFFYVFVGGKRVGYSQISHATSEFDITDFVRRGDNAIDVIVVKWCASTYLEDQDKFRFSGIFRSVYLLRRPQKHVRDFKLSTRFAGKNGVLTVQSLSDIPFCVTLQGQTQTVAPQKSVTFTVENVQAWTAEAPTLYDAVISAEGEKILQRVGFRTSEVKNGVWLYNGAPLKLKGVNRHEFSPTGGATVTIEETIRDMELMKWANVNAIRTCHYPDVPEFYDLCDAKGFYVVDEADLETHGMAAKIGGGDRKVWQEFANSGMADEGVTDREIALYERDKNRTSVVIWSLGNESNWGSMFYAGADYIHAHDDRPTHYENTWEMADKTDYYTTRIDIASRMYPPLSDMQAFLRDEKETRPLLLCEYTHAMGNSNGDVNDYWNLIDSSDRFAGAFVWEWRDHAIKTERGYLYGGDFGEDEHDGNFCVDGLLNPDFTPKSGLHEVRAVYGGKREQKAQLPACAPLSAVSRTSPVAFTMNGNGELTSLGKVKFRRPLAANVFRAYIDNDLHDRASLQKYEKAHCEAYEIVRDGSDVTVRGKAVVACFAPLMEYTVRYSFHNEGVDVRFSYELADFASDLPRAGLTFALSKKAAATVAYSGYGPHESYIDKHLGSAFGTYESTPEKEYFRYVKPQESGTHFACTEAKLGAALRVVAEKPFSFGAIPYAAHTLASVAHDFSLPESNLVHVHLSVADAGVGTHSCGPELAPQYRVPKKGENTFRILISNAD